MGFQNTVSNNYAVAMGNTNTITGDYAVAMGNTNTVSNHYSVSFGQNNETTHQFTLSQGYDNNITGNYTTALGYQNQSNQQFCFMSGQFLRLNSNDFAASFGRYNSDSADLIFSIGNGTSAQARTNAFSMTDSGSAGIGTNVPKSNLDIKSNFGISSYVANSKTDIMHNMYYSDGWKNINQGPASLMRLFGGSGETSSIRFYTTTAALNHTANSSLGNEGSGVNERMRITADGNVGIGEDNPTRKLCVNASGSYDGIMLNNSDGKTLAKLAQGASTSDSYFGLYSWCRSRWRGHWIKCRDPRCFNTK